MAHFRISEAADLLGVSDDTMRRWIASGVLTAQKDSAGRLTVAGDQLAAHAKAGASAVEDRSRVKRSARNRFVGLVTKIDVDGLVAQVELQCGRNRIVSLMTAEGAREMGLEVGSRGVAVIKATMVIIETDTETQE